MMDFSAIALLAFAYFLGAIPSGYLIARKIKGIDIREHGSGNPGAANVYRVCGKWPGIATALLDILKGYVPSYLALLRYPDHLGFALAAGALAVFGHNWTIFLKLRGGKGVATSAGVFAALLPVPILCATLAFAIAAKISKHISVGSLAGALVLPVASLLSGAPRSLSVMAGAISSIIMIRHISNIKRLLAGGEFYAGSLKKGS